VIELTAQARQISEMTFETFAAFGAATLIYLVLALVAYQLMAAIERALRTPSNEPAAGAPLAAPAANGVKL
jgi:glutamate/aspartate transport system permease protein